jgi:S-formylglutathione hydrolase FrmB
MSRFSHWGISVPEFEPDSLRFITVRSPALNARGDITLFLPPGCENEQNLPVSILMHGVHGSHWNWAFKGGAHRTAQRLIESGELRPMVLAMPSDGLWADGSGYLQLPWANYESWIIEDVRDVVTEAVPSVGPDSTWFIAGLSMGGYGAFRLGAKHPEQFAGISGHSSITHFDQLPKFVSDPLDIYGPQDKHEIDVAHWMIKNKDTLPPLRFDCGKDDVLIEENRELHKRLTEHDVPHTYTEFNGEHTWDYWAAHIEDTLRFFGSIPC